jgi:zinc/manganese transport system substrate-binding protein
VSADSEASAKDVAKLIRRIKAEKIPAVFLENVTDHQLLDQIAKETGAKIGGTLYSDALSEANGPAATYLDMFRHNIETLTAALSSYLIDAIEPIGLGRRNSIPPTSS